MRNYRKLWFIGGIISCMYYMNLILKPRVYYRNMFADHVVYDFNLYSQAASVALFMVLLLLLLFNKSKPIYFTIVGIVTALLNIVAMVYYTSVTKDFYINIYAFRGIILLLIGISLQSNHIHRVKLLGLYFIIEFLILQVIYLSNDSIFFMDLTVDTSLLGAVILFVLGIMIPIIMNFFLVDEYLVSDTRNTISLDMRLIIRISSWISIGYLVILIMLNVRLLNPVIADGGPIIVLYYITGAALRIALYTVFIYGFVTILTNSVKRWLFPVITFTIIFTVFYPYSINIYSYAGHFDWAIGVYIDLLVLIVLTVFIYLRKYNVSFYLSLWFLINFLLASIGIGNVQASIIYSVDFYHDFYIIFRILYYFIPITLSLVLFEKMKKLKKAQ